MLKRLFLSCAYVLVLAISATAIEVTLLTADALSFGDATSRPVERRKIRKSSSITRETYRKPSTGRTGLYKKSVTAYRKSSGNQSFFGSTEIIKDNISPFKKWTSIISEHTSELSRYRKSCRRESDSGCYRRKMFSFLDQVADEPVSRKVEMINSFFNETPYITDPDNWNVDDYWVTPYVFMRKNGDCEDFAISKYYGLKYTGFPESDMRIVIVKDTNLGIAHAILVVNVNGEHLVLDNQIPVVTNARKIKHYYPYYSINSRNYWLHKQG